MVKTDWRVRLSEWLKSQQRREVKAGSHDNFTFTAGCIGAVTGEDPARGLRGKYKSEAGAAKVFERMGYADHVEYLVQGRRPVPRASARAGYLAVFWPERMVGIVSSGQILMLADQIQYVPMDRASEFYEVA